MAKRPRRESKSLSIRTLVQIGVSSFENAYDLGVDAEVLFTNQRWSRTFFLSLIAFEELGKSCLSLGAAAKIRLGVFGPDEQQRYWAQFADHRSKTATLTALQEAFYSKLHLPEIIDRNRRDSEWVQNHEFVKLGALYADIYANGEVQAPGGFYNEPAKVEPLLHELRMWITLFEDNVRPMFDAVETCPLDDCRKWVDAVRGIL